MALGMNPTPAPYVFRKKTNAAPATRQESSLFVRIIRHFGQEIVLVAGFLILGFWFLALMGYSSADPA